MRELFQMVGVLSIAVRPILARNHTVLSANKCATRRDTEKTLVELKKFGCSVKTETFYQYSAGPPLWRILSRADSVVTHTSPNKEKKTK
jgi:hypothetical protein